MNEGYKTYLRTVFGDEIASFLAHEPIPLFVRCNPLRSDRQTVISRLERYGAAATVHGLTDEAIGVRRTDTGLGPGGMLEHFLGHYAVQSLGSMVPPICLDPKPGEQVLDLCAAPGSKTTQIASMMGNTGHVLANDYNNKRLPALSSAIDRAGLSNISVSIQRGERLPRMLPGTFDRVLADVPCSGLGRNDRLRIGESWFVKKGLTSLPELQHSLLVAALRLVKVGGRVVYSTCSLAQRENEAVLTRVLDHHPVKVVPPPELPGLSVRPGQTEGYNHALSLARRITPWENPTEGFFVAILEKTGSLSKDEKKTPPAMDFKLTWGHDDAAIADVLGQLGSLYGIGPEAWAGYQFRLEKGRLWMLSPGIERVWAQVLRAGLPIAKYGQRVWRLTSSGVHHLAPHLGGDNTLEISRTQFGELTAKGWANRLETQASAGRFPLIAFGSFGPIAPTIHQDGKIRWKQPRQYRVPE